MDLWQAKEWLRVDNDDNNYIIESLLEATNEYIEQATGVKCNQRDEDGHEIPDRPLVITIKKFLLSLWYDPTQADTDKLQRAIDSLLKLL